MKEICMKEAWKSNLDYLRGLREDIERIKDNIEKKIEGIEQEEITIPTLNSPVKRTEQIKPIYIPDSHKPRSTRVSIEKIPDKPAKSRAKSRYLNSSTRMSDNMENRNEKQGRPSGPRKGSTGNYNLSRVETNNLANISRALKGKDNMPAGNHQKGGGNVKEGTAKSNFMNDKKATSYVNQLINDFKEIHNLRNAARK